MLTSQQVVADPGARPGAVAIARLTFGSESTEGSVDVKGVAPTRVTLNRGHAGETGTVIAEFERNDDGDWQLAAHGTRLSLADDIDAPGYYVRLESKSGALRGQVLPEHLHLQVMRLSGQAPIAQFPLAGQAIVAVTANLMTGAFRVRLTTSKISSAINAEIRASDLSGQEQRVVHLVQSTHVRDVWGSADINNKCFNDHLSTDVLRAYREGRLVVQLDMLTGPMQIMRARLAPPDSKTTRIAYTKGSSP